MTTQVTTGMPVSTPLPGTVPKKKEFKDYFQELTIVEAYEKNPLKDTFEDCVDFHKKKIEEEKKTTEAKRKDKADLLKIIENLKKSDQKEINSAEIISMLSKMAGNFNLLKFFLRFLKDQKLATLDKKELDLIKKELELDKNKIQSNIDKSFIKTNKIFDNIKSLEREQLKYGENSSAQEDIKKFNTQRDEEFAKQNKIFSEKDKIDRKIQKLNNIQNLDKKKAVKTHIHELEEQAKSMGVKAKLTSKNITKSEQTIAAIKMVKEAGFDLTGLEIRITTEGDNKVIRLDKKLNEDKVNRVYGTYFDNTNNIYLKKNFSSSNAYGSWSVDANLGTPIHEMGHYLHQKLSSQKYSDSNKMSLNDSIKKLLTEKVSGYAAKNPYDAIAEIFTGLMFGRTYSPEIMGFYEALGGPMTDKLREQIKNRTCTA